MRFPAHLNRPGEGEDAPRVAPRRYGRCRHRWRRTLTPRSRGHGSGGGDESPSGRRSGRGWGSEPATVEQGQGHAREVFQHGRPTAAGGGPSGSAGSRPSSAGQPQGVPYGFRDFGQFREFATRFRDRMRELYPDLEMGFQGSSVTGRSAETGAPFDEGRPSAQPAQPAHRCRAGPPARWPPGRSATRTSRRAAARATPRVLPRRAGRRPGNASTSASSTPDRR
jgi:hypothetical protein